MRKECFGGCHSLRQIKIPDFVKQIGKDCFRNCKELTELVVPDDDRETIFSDCTSLAELELLDPEKQITKGTIECTAQNISPIFYTIKSPLHVATLSACLDVVVIPLSVHKLPDRSFFNCRSITGVLFLSMKVERLGDDCFNGCLSLERMNLPEEIRHIGSRCFKDCHILFCTWLKFTSSYDITIGEGAFEGCSCLQSLSLPLDRTIWLPNCFKGTGIM
jgi:hypothetical protein